MRPQYHVASSAIVAGILYVLFKSWSMSFSCFLSGILIDLDHIYDFIKETGSPIKFKELYGLAKKNNITHCTIVFHSWELVLLLFMVAWFTNWNPWIAGVLIGFGHHMIMDAFHNKVTILPYSFIWRWKNNFEC